jgi:RNA polymerase sigma-70 factor, ECF subfamily
MLSSSRPGPQAGREEFHDLFVELFPRLRSFFRACGFQAADAEDLSQTTLRNVYRSREQYRGGGGESGGLDAWVYSIARNVARDEWRRRGRSAEMEPVEETLPAEDPSAADRAAGREDLKRTVAALSKLPLGMRTCLLLHVQQELPYGEVARRLGLSLPTVKVQIWNARRRLRSLRMAEDEER